MLGSPPGGMLFLKLFALGRDEPLHAKLIGHLLPESAGKAACQLARRVALDFAVRDLGQIAIECITSSWERLYSSLSVGCVMICLRFATRRRNRIQHAVMTA